MIITSKRPLHSLRGATHRAKHDASLRKHYRNVDGQPTARGAARNRLPSCIQHTTKEAGKGNKNNSPHLCDYVGQKDANDGAGARLGMCLEGSNAGFVPPKCNLGLHEHTVGDKKTVACRTSIVITQGNADQKKRARRSARSLNVLKGRC